VPHIEQQQHAKQYGSHQEALGQPPPEGRIARYRLRPREDTRQVALPTLIQASLRPGPTNLNEEGGDFPGIFPLAH
jgi:hypothetical protein